MSGHVEQVRSNVVDVLVWIVLIFKERKRTDSVYDLLAMDVDPIFSGKVNEVRELGIASVVDVSVSNNRINQSAPSAPTKHSPEVFPSKVFFG